MIKLKPSRLVPHLPVLVGALILGLLFGYLNAQHIQHKNQKMCYMVIVNNEVCEK